MNKLATPISILALLGVIILGVLKFKEPSRPARAKERKVIMPGDSNSVPVTANNAIAYVNLDTLENNYAYFKKKKVEFEEREKKITVELEGLVKKFQAEALDFQKKVNEGKYNSNPAEGEALQKRLAQQEQDIELKRQNLGSGLLKAQEDFNKELQENIRAFLQDFAADKGYDYVLAFSYPSSILYANPELDITYDVVDALNSGKDFTKKNKENKK
jgi:outer membrane protein